MYGKAAVRDSCPSQRYLKRVSSGRKRKHFCYYQRTRVLIMTQWLSLFSGSVKALERWALCAALPKHAGSAPLARSPASSGLLCSFCAADNVVMWGGVLSFFFRGAPRKRELCLMETKMRNAFLFVFEDVLFKLLCYSGECIILQSLGSSRKDIKRRAVASDLFTRSV